LLTLKHVNIIHSGNLSQKKVAQAMDDLNSSVVMDGIEPPTQGFSVLCSTN
jgi:hypothetical protein